MDITFHGLSCFSLEGKTATVLIDPFDEKAAGLKPLKVKADVCLSNADNELQHNLSMLDKEATVFDWPGEYEARGVIIHGIAAHDRPREKESDKKDDAKPVIIWSMNFDGFRICHLSTVGHKLTPEMLEVIGDVDILFVPIGGHECLSAGKAHEVIEQIDPRIVIPMNYKTPGVKLPLAEIDVFLKEVGVHNPQVEKVLKLGLPSSLPQESTEYKILEVQ